MLDPAEVPQVRAATQRYRAEKARIEAAGNAGLAALLARRAVTRKAAE